MLNETKYSDNKKTDNLPEFSHRIGDLDKKKYLVPSDLTVGQFYFLIRLCIVCKDL